MIVSIFIILLLGTTWIVSAILILKDKRQRKKKNQWLIYLAITLMIMGATGFFGSALSAIGGLNWLPNSFEWPMGYVNNVIRLKNGNTAVPHTSSGRIQIYDKDLHYLHGWNVDASGGVFKIRELDDGQLEVITARGQRRMVYGINGNEISKQRYNRDYCSIFPETGETIYIPTSPLLIGFTNPFIAWTFAIAGMLIIGIREKGIKFLYKRS